MIIILSLSPKLGLSFSPLFLWFIVIFLFAKYSYAFEIFKILAILFWMWKCQEPEFETRPCIAKYLKSTSIAGQCIRTNECERSTWEIFFCKIKNANNRELDII